MQGLAEELDAIEASNAKDFDDDTVEDPDLISAGQKSVSEDSEVEKPEAEKKSPSSHADQPPLTEEELQPSTSKRKFDEVDSNYKESYAEYAVPELRSDLLPTVKCDQCGAKILDDLKALQTHRDHHFAQELSRQLKGEQREERQKECRQKDAPKPTPPKKQKKAAGSISASSSSSASPGNSIAKFFSAKTTQEPPRSDVPMQQCSECKAFIKSVDMPEHIDYHVARNLQRELNQQDLRTRAAALSKEKTSPAQSKKAKPKQLNATIAGSSGGTKSIAQFFSQSH